MKLKNKFALITGASEGLGKVICEAFLQEGASLMICARSENKLRATFEELSKNLQSNQKLAMQIADMGDIRQIDLLVDAVLNEFPQLDIIVNNAGIYGPKGLQENIPWKEWENAIRINLFGPVYLCGKILPFLKKRGYGKIINLSGGGASNPLPRLSSYATSKAGLVRFTETLAMELKDYNIDVNAVAPGPLNTRLLDEIIEAGAEKVGREFYEKALRQRDEGGAPLSKGASLSVFLASSASDGITGKLISALWDPWDKLPEHLDDLKNSDVYTLRRIIPTERDMAWGN